MAGTHAALMISAALLLIAAVAAWRARAEQGSVAAKQR
jgi:hypothetical protein